MSNRNIPTDLLPHLAGQFERGIPILFTGAGFSTAAKNIEGSPIPSYDELKEALWKICFPGEPLDQNTSLQDLFEHARMRHQKALQSRLIQLLTVNGETLPSWYQLYFRMPWARIYTLNIDDLALAASRHFNLTRAVSVISATNPTTQSVQVSVAQTAGSVQEIHLNGFLSDIPDNVTFSATQYGERLARPESWYLLLTSEMISRPVVFVGTRLDEPPLWQHVALRGGRGGRGLRELRPRSYLVTPRLDRARRSLLAELNVEWVEMDAKEFAEEILTHLTAAGDKGLQTLAAAATDTVSKPLIADVGVVANHPLQPSDFLLGEEPTWSDLQSGRAIARECDSTIATGVEDSVRNDSDGALIIITGTAGSGKSTGLMRIALRLAGEGVRTGWIDRYVELSPREIRAAMREAGAPRILAIDDADRYGTELAPLVRDLAIGDRHVIVLLGIRSGKVDAVLNPVALTGTSIKEFSMPPLADRDIDSLLDVLDRENRLGILKGKSRSEQIRAFRDRAGRELLVAMIEATSGKKFEDKAIDELRDLTDIERFVYAVVAVASAYRFALGRDEILLAVGDRTNAALNVLDQLIRRHVIKVAPDPASVQARHRVIAEIILRELQKEGALVDVVSGLALLGAAKIYPSLKRSAKPWRLLRIVLNHDFLIRTVGLENGRNLYGTLEQTLAWDSHYWLQRGSLEVEFGNLSLAENFLNQARGLAPEDALVETEYAYLLFRQAIQNPGGIESPNLVSQATSILEDLIQRRGGTDPYPYHVLGSQGLAWSRQGIVSASTKGDYLRLLLRRLEDGLKKHPRERDIQQLHADVKREILNLAVKSPATAERFPS